MSAQAMRALERANEVRLAKAELKKELKKGKRTFTSLLDEVPDCCAKLPVFELLQWCPKVGPSRAQRLARGYLSETLPLRSLCGHTREQLLSHLQEEGVQ